jgi:hypothetical protein
LRSGWKACPKTPGCAEQQPGQGRPGPAEQQSGHESGSGRGRDDGSVWQELIELEMGPAEQCKPKPAAEADKESNRVE